MIIRRESISVASVIAVLSALSILIWVLSPEHKDHVTRSLRSETRVRVLVASLQLYAQANQNAYPPEGSWVDHLSQAGFITVDEAFAPEREGITKPYTFVPAQYDEDAARILVYGNPNPGQRGVMTGFADYTVRLLSRDEFQRLLAEQTVDSP